MSELFVSEIKPSMKVEIENIPYVVISNQFVKPGKGQAFNRIKLKNLLTGKNIEKTYKSSEKIKIAMLGPFPPATGGIATNIQNILKSPLREKYNFLNVNTMSRKYGTQEYLKERIYSKLCRIIKDIFHFVTVLFREAPMLVHINTSFNRGAFWRDSVYLLVSKIFRKKVFFNL